MSPSRQGSREQLFGRISCDELKFANSKEPWSVRIEGETIRFNGPGLPSKIEGTVNGQSHHTALVFSYDG